MTMFWIRQWQEQIDVKLPALIATLVVVATVPVSAREPSRPPLFEVVDVDRDTVPAGTPEAFEAAFGRKTQYDGGGRWYELTREVDGHDITFVPLTLISLPDGRKALITTGASDCTSHACSGVNAVHYLQREGARYQVDGEWLDVGASGTFGNPARRWGWTAAITGAPVLYTEGGGVWQGYACSAATLTELGAHGPVEIASIPIHYSNGGAVDTGTVTLTGTITAAEQGRSFTVSYAGSSQFDELYVRGADGRYRLEGDTKVPHC